MATIQQAFREFKRLPELNTSTGMWPHLVIA